MEGIDLNNKGLSWTDIYELSNSKLVGVDGSVSLVYSPVIDNIYIPQNSCGDDTGLYHVANSGLGGDDAFLFVDIINSFRLVPDHSVEVATERIFRLCDVRVLSKF